MLTVWAREESLGIGKNGLRILLYSFQHHISALSLATVTRIAVFNQLATNQLTSASSQLENHTPDPIGSCLCYTPLGTLD